MDAVYYVKHSLINEELRYSLRSVAKNWPSSCVTIVGFKPPWVTGVNHIPTVQYPGQKHPNALRNQLAALTSKDLPEIYWSMNDDFFVMQPGETQYHWGRVTDVLAGYGPERLGTLYYASMQATLEICRDLGFDEPLSYAAHVPGVIHKDIMRETVVKYNHTGVWVQHLTIANNLAHSGGTELPHGDVKIYDCNRQVPVWSADSEYLSCHDRSFKVGGIGRFIRERFPDPCKFEA